MEPDRLILLFVPLSYLEMITYLTIDQLQLFRSSPASSGELLKFFDTLLLSPVFLSRAVENFGPLPRNTSLFLFLIFGAYISRRLLESIRSCKRYSHQLEELSSMSEEAWRWLCEEFVDAIN